MKKSHAAKEEGQAYFYHPPPGHCGGDLRGQRPTDGRGTGGGQGSVTLSYVPEAGVAIDLDL